MAESGHLRAVAGRAVAGRVPAAPKHLKAASKRLWRAVLEQYELSDPELDVLRLALEARDRCEQARLILAEEGPIYHDRFGSPRKHPAVAIEENARLACIRAWRELSLDMAPPPDVRPSRIGGRYVRG